MFLFVLFSLGLLSSALSAPNPYSLKTGCSEDNCVLPDCRCSTLNTPGALNTSDIPQLVLFTFDDAVNAANFEYYQQAFFDKVNPDGCPVGSTYFVSHEYTDYTKVHELHAKGHEIALHSISHNPTVDYWTNLPLEDMISEFGDERQIVSHFANIPIEDLKGLRLPLLQMSADTSFKAMEEIGLTYDSSWPSFKEGMWPYTLDYSTSQDCPIGPCPTESHPGIWVSPMLYWTDNEDNVCAMVDACVNIPEDVQGKFEFMKRNFETSYNGKRAPVGVYLHASWFAFDPKNFEAYMLFVDYLQTLPDVYLVSVSRALEWVKNPQTIANLKNAWPNCQATHEIDCSVKNCELPKGEENRYMNQCHLTCPNTYPWLGNPLGQ